MASIEHIMKTRFPQLVSEFPHYALEILRKAAEGQEWDEERTIEELYLDAESIELEDYCEEGKIKNPIEGFSRLGKAQILARIRTRPPTDIGLDVSEPEEKVLELEDSPEDLPIYLLANYLVYAPTPTLTYVPLSRLRDDYESLTVEANIYSVSIDAEEEGAVNVEDSLLELDEPSDQDSVDGKRLQLTSIVESRAHVESDGAVSFWIKTSRAWYKFGSPRGDYRAFACEFVGGGGRIERLFTGYVAVKGYGLEEYLEDEGARYYGLEAVKKRLKGDFKVVFGDLEGWDTALSESEFELDGPLLEFVIEALDEPEGSLAKQKRKRPERKSAIPKIKKTKPLTERFSVATPWIAGLAKGYLLSTLLRVVDGQPKAPVNISSDNDDGSPDPLSCEETIHSSTKQETWEDIYGLTPLLKSKPAPKSISSLDLAISRGDFVLVCAAPLDTARTLSQDNLWIGRVEYTLKKAGEPHLHLRWFCQSRKTILAEFADPRELFLLAECADVPVTAILRKVEVEKVGREFRGKGESGGRARFYYRFLYNITDASFQDADKFEGISDASDGAFGWSNKCTACAITRQETEKTTPHFNPDDNTLSYRGVSYHPLDCVYLDPLCEGAPFTLGILLAINTSDTSSSSGYYSADPPSTPSEITLTIRLLGRVTDFIPRTWGRLGPSTCHKRLYLTAQSEDVPAERLRGRFFLWHKEALDKLDKEGGEPGKRFYEFIGREHCFYVDAVMLGMPPGMKPGYEDLREVGGEEMAYLLRKEAWAEEVRALREPKEKGYKLRALDLFSGCGGLTHGIESVAEGTVVTKWAVELSTDAAEAFKKNYKGEDVTVYNGDANKLLEKAILEHSSDSENPWVKMKDLSGGNLPPMPRVGEVDFIYGGPPCQGFSGMNRFQKADCMKNSLIATFLSYVDHYKPSYVLLENVQGLAQAKMHRTGERKGDAVAMGFVKFILRALTSLGYQTRLGLLQAGQFGVPQSRTRFIFWGARIGVELPLFPAPTHTFEKPVRSLTLFGVDTPERLSTRVRGDNAPHRRVCVGDVLYDLMPFRYLDSRHWDKFEDVHKDGPVRLEEFEDEEDEGAVMGECPENQLERFDSPQRLWWRRVEVPDQQDDEAVQKADLRWGSDSPARQELFDAVSSDGSKFIGHQIQPYRTTPLNEYQRAFRGFNAYDPACYTRKVQQHVTRPFPAGDVQRIVNVPLRPGADHRDLPYEMRPWCLANKDSRAAAHNFYPGLIGRLNEDAAFRTAITTISITGNSGTVLHPRQQRVISVREHARSQGFPDSFLFVDRSGGTGEMHTQVGNAVPLPLGAALGRGLHRAVMEQVKREKMKGAVEDSAGDGGVADLVSGDLMDLDC